MITVNGRMPTINKFGNGETQVVFDSNVYNFDTYFVEWLYEDDAEIMQLRQVHSLLKTHGTYGATNDVTCAIPYFPYERMDRVAGNNPFSLQEMVELLPKDWDYIVVEPHSDVLAKQFKQANLDLTITYFNRGFLPGRDIRLMVFPDKGSVKRYLSDPDSQMMKDVIDCLAHKEIILVGGKHRDFHTHELSEYEVTHQLALDKDGKVEIVDWDRTHVLNLIKNAPQGTYKPFTVSVVDDVVSYGGTFIKLQKYLEEALALGTPDMLRFELSVAHMEPSVFKGSLLDYYSKIHTTNSITGGTVFPETVFPDDSQIEVHNVRDCYYDYIPQVPNFK